ncbi:hypothetical protein D9615_008330 [Tricholomella constricta]|uniref:Regulatory P domain-containing protein n=1 Tax=Tricholomella constricta TaxID=117010 RepID=A0A8H5HDK3_9AGAR|nr:hypothetical protein D9615_008330 [Tricholomella constricta]
MRSLPLWTLVAIFSGALAQTIPNPARKIAYQSGQVHEAIMRNKTESFAARRAAGKYDSRKHRPLSYIPCVNGRAGEFKCSNVDLYSFKSHAELGSATGEGSSSWGWTHKGRDFVVFGQADGAAFIEILKNGEIDYLGRLPQTEGALPSIWREIRVTGDIAVIGSEAVNHHIQFFDLKKLLKIKKNEKPKTFDSIKDASIFRGLPIGRTHNVVVNNELPYVVSVGSQPRTSQFAAGLVFIDIRDPSNPTLLGYQGEDGYVHDAQCLPYRGPDERFKGRDICYGYNEDTLTIYDVTNPANATIISRTGYVGASYTHQGWVLDPHDQSYLLLDDELDERNKAGLAADGFPVTYIWDIKDLTAPTLTGHYKTSVKGIDHNQYVANGKSYQSNYGAGLRILDVSSIPRDPTGAGVHEVGFFDIYPEDDESEGGGEVQFVGSWSSYGLFKSGWIFINTIERGAYVVRYTGK